MVEGRKSNGSMLRSEQKIDVSTDSPQDVGPVEDKGSVICQILYKKIEDNSIESSLTFMFGDKPSLVYELRKLKKKRRCTNQLPLLKSPLVEVLSQVLRKLVGASRFLMK